MVAVRGPTEPGAPEPGRCGGQRPGDVGCEALLEHDDASLKGWS
jgi:hypothetical protein